MFFYLYLQLIEDWISEVISNRTNRATVEKSQVTFIWSIAVAIFCFGGMIGGLMTGYIAEKFGRKGGLLISNTLVVLSAAFQGECIKVKLLNFNIEKQRTRLMCKIKTFT